MKFKQSFSTPRSLYVGLPLEEIDNTYAKLEQDYFKNKDEADKTEVLAKNIEVAENDRNIKEDAITPVLDGLATIAGNNNYERMGSKVIELAKKLATNEALNAASKNYQTMLEEGKRISEIKSRGIQPLVFTKPENFNTQNPDGSINYYQSDVQEPLNYDAKIADIWSIIMPDAVNMGIVTAQEADDIKTGRAKLITPQIGDVTEGGISPEKIEALRQLAANRYQTTNEYKQMFRVMSELERRYDSYSPEERQRLINAEISNKVADVGFMKTFRALDIKWKDDAIAVQNNIIANKAKAEAEATRKDLELVNITALVGQGIVDPRNLSPSFEEDKQLWNALNNNISANERAIKETEKVLGEATNLTQEQKIEKEQELKTLKIERDFNIKQKIDIENRATQDFASYLLNPVNEDGTPNTSVTPITEDQLKTVKYINVEFGDGMFAPKEPSTEQILGVISENETAQKYYDWVVAGLKALGATDYGAQEDAKEIISKSFKTATTYNRTSDGSVTIADEDYGSRLQDGTFANSVESLVKEKAKIYNRGVIKDQTKFNETIWNVKSALAPLQGYNDMLVKMSDKDNQDHYYEISSASNYYPNVYDFSSAGVDGSKLSVATNQLSRIATNQWTSFAFIENGTLVEPQGVNNVVVTGITDYVPGQGFMLTGYYESSNDVDEKGKSLGTKHVVYMKPKTTDGIIDSNINKIVEDTLLGDYANYKGSIDEKNRAIDLAHAIRHDYVDKQFDRFRSVPIAKGQMLSTDVVIDDNHKYKVIRRTDNKGTTFELYNHDGSQFEGGLSKIVYNDLERMVQNLEDLQNMNNQLPVDASAQGLSKDIFNIFADNRFEEEDYELLRSLNFQADNSLAGRTKNLFHLTSGDIRNGNVFGVPVNESISYNDGLNPNQTSPVFNSYEDGWKAGVSKIRNIYNGRSKTFSPTMTIQDFRDTWSQSNKDTLDQKLANLLGKTKEEVNKMKIQDINEAQLINAIMQSEVTPKVYEQVIKPLLNLTYGI